MSIAGVYASKSCAVLTTYILDSIAFLLGELLLVLQGRGKYLCYKLKMGGDYVLPTEAIAAMLPMGIDLDDERVQSLHTVGLSQAEVAYQ